MVNTISRSTPLSEYTYTSKFDKNKQRTSKAESNKPCKMMGVTFKQSCQRCHGVIWLLTFKCKTRYRSHVEIGSRGLAGSKAIDDSCLSKSNTSKALQLFLFVVVTSLWLQVTEVFHCLAQQPTAACTKLAPDSSGVRPNQATIIPRHWPACCRCR